MPTLLNRSSTLDSDGLFGLKFLKIGHFEGNYGRRRFCALVLFKNQNRRAILSYFTRKGRTVKDGVGQFLLRYATHSTSRLEAACSPDIPFQFQTASLACYFGWSFIRIWSAFGINVNLDPIWNRFEFWTSSIWNSLLRQAEAKSAGTAPPHLQPEEALRCRRADGVSRVCHQYVYIMSARSDEAR